MWAKLGPGAPFLAGSPLSTDGGDILWGGPGLALAGVARGWASYIMTDGLKHGPCWAPLLLFWSFLHCLPTVGTFRGMVPIGRWLVLSGCGIYCMCGAWLVFGFLGCAGRVGLVGYLWCGCWMVGLWVDWIGGFAFFCALFLVDCDCAQIGWRICSVSMRMLN